MENIVGLRLEEVRDCDVARVAANVRACRLVEGYLRYLHKGTFGHLIYAANLSAKYNAVLSGISTIAHDHVPGPDENWYASPPAGGWDSGEPGKDYGVPLGYFQPNRLLSYWYIKNKKPDFLRRYVSTGLIEDFELRDKLGNPFEPQFDPRRLPQS